ncbi:MAG: LPS export ABC transporter periplasmic protein LptC [Candidatus Omnitrophota bacterium]|jgi:LPS export ABC transporter protein LptC
MEDQKILKPMKKIIIYLVLVCAVVYGCAKKEAPKPVEPPKQAAVETPPADFVKHKVMSFDLEGLNDNGSKKWDVKGESAEAIAENQVQLNNVVANSYGENDQATISANKGIYDKVNNSVRLEENVKATIENTGQNQAPDIMNFSGLTNSSPDPKEQKVDKGKKTRTQITCDGEAQFNYEKNLAYFNKNVKVVNEEGYINADKITVDLDPVTKKVYQIVAEGNVKIQRGENTTYSNKATYVEADKKIILEGQPRLVIYQEGNLQDNVFGKK